ncbi:NDP-hexose 2,3-dehydratase family protein [Streptomyces cyaneofuscatus]|uniref:NDP-hexose 2,3-dehydratase family protein n=1 Tax=Streptomyces cyaneofuscatus TaxID=66883 RepID=UPI00366495E4
MEKSRTRPHPSVTGAFGRWWEERRRATPLTVTPVSFADLHQWHFAPEGGDLVHSTGRFFAVAGMRRYEADGTVRDQPVISQPEIGMLGILVKRLGGVPHALMQAKAEPGNVGSVQLSPTVQATRSNYTRVHRGHGTRHLEHFSGDRRGRVLVDSLQSEQGAWFWRKRNRNVLVETTAEVADHPDYHWVELDELRRLLRTDHLVNMDARSVLGTAPLFRPPPDSDDPFVRALARSYAEPPAGYDDEQEVRTWLNDAKSRCTSHARLLPLSGIDGWTRTDGEIGDDDGTAFRIIAVHVTATGREVPGWSQPLLAPRSESVATFLVREIDGTLHLLVQARAEPGLHDMLELAPTVHRHYPGEAPGPFDALAESEDPARVRYDTRHSEEGGRFHRAITRHRVIDVGAEVPVDVPESYRWLTVRQLRTLARQGYYVNVEARSLLACLHSLW